MKSKPGSGKRQDRNFEIVVNHIIINEDQLPQVSRQSMAALKGVFGHSIKKYSGTFHHKPGSEHAHFLVMSEAPKSKSAVKASISASMALIFDTKKDPDHRTVEFMCGGDWEISHGESVDGTTCTLPKVPGFLSTVPKRVKGDFVPKPAYDEEVFNAPPKKEQTSKRQRTMKYLQGPDEQSLREEVVVQHKFLEGHPPDFYRFRLLEPIRKLQSNTSMLTVPKLKHYYNQAFMALFHEHLLLGNLLLQAAISPWTSNGLAVDVMSASWESLAAAAAASTGATEVL
eukprot:jgi/Astpho2/4816/Aster-07516